LAYAHILFHKWGNPAVPFIPMVADLDSMLERFDAAILIGDPALMALEDRAERYERTGEDLAYHDLAAEWGALTGLPFVSAVWAMAGRGPIDRAITNDFIQSRDHGLQNIENLVAEWSAKLPLSEETIRNYLTTNIRYTLDIDCLEGMRVFFRMAAECGVLPEYSFTVNE
jgi:chorismate dehydratase